MSVQSKLEKIVAWYVQTAHGQWEGGDRLPFYCDPARVGAFAVDPERLAKADEAALFRLLVTFALYQSRRDVDIMALQRSIPAQTVETLTDLGSIAKLVQQCRCELAVDSHLFSRECTVRRDLGRDRAICDYRPRTSCHVKAASLAIRRMGDMGKIPTSAFLYLRDAGGFAKLLDATREDGRTPASRAAMLVGMFTRIHRIGIKLATMFVSALSTPELSPGLSPWAPTVSGSGLVVIDTNVAIAISALWRGAPPRYEARAAWFRDRASKVDLRRFRRGWPKSSPRLVQQAVYLFRSRSNRVAYADTCQSRREPCPGCVPEICPFITRRPQLTRST